jgi:LysM repeat protein
LFRHGVRRLTALVVPVVVFAGCSMGSSARPAATTTSGSIPTRATPGPPTTTTLPSTTYRVRRGESLIQIANRFHEPLVAIMRRNHIANADRLAEGQTLVITPFSGLTLVVTPPQGRPGRAFQLALRGATPGETITFAIDSPAGRYTGGPHTAAPNGTVTATYEPASGDPTGLYRVTATGTLGTTIQAMFRLVAPAVRT